MKGGLLSRKATYQAKSQDAAVTASAATTYRVSPAKANKKPNSSNHSLFPLAEFHEENLPSGGAWRTLEPLPRCSLHVGGRRSRPVRLLVALCGFMAGALHC